MSYSFDCCNILKTGSLNSITAASTLVSTPHCTDVSLPTVYPTSFSLRSIQKTFITVVFLEHSANHIATLFKNQTFHDSPPPAIAYQMTKSLPAIYLLDSSQALSPTSPQTICYRQVAFFVCIFYLTSFVQMFSCALLSTESPYPSRRTPKAASMNTLSCSLP